MHLSKVFIMNSSSPLIAPTHSTLLVFNNSKTWKIFNHGNSFLYSLQSFEWCKPKNSALVEFFLHVGWALFSARAQVQNSTGIKNFMVSSDMACKDHLVLETFSTIFTWCIVWMFIIGSWQHGVAFALIILQVK